MASIQLGDEQVTALIHKSILEALGEQGRDQIIGEVIKYLTTQTTGYMGKKDPSPLQRVMNDAAERIAHTVVTERLSNDQEFKDAIDSLYVEAMRRATTTDRESIVSSMAAKMADALTGNR